MDGVGDSRSRVPTAKRPSAGVMFAREAEMLHSQTGVSKSNQGLKYGPLNSRALSIRTPRQRTTILWKQPNQQGLEAASRAAATVKVLHQNPLAPHMDPTVDSKKLEHGCRMIHAGRPSLFWFGIRGDDIPTFWLLL